MLASSSGVLETALDKPFVAVSVVLASGASRSSVAMAYLRTGDIRGFVDPDRHD
jgi:hypothetical protein